MPVEHDICRQRTPDEDSAVYRAQQARRSDEELHAKWCHPGWEYRITRGPRKAWDAADRPPAGEGWIRNTFYCPEGWERFDHHEESYWMRPLHP